MGQLPLHCAVEQQGAPAYDDAADERALRTARVLCGGGRAQPQVGAADGLGRLPLHTALRLGRVRTALWLHAAGALQGAWATRERLVALAPLLKAVPERLRSREFKQMAAAAAERLAALMQ
jgi:hypothetical protein